MAFLSFLAGAFSLALSGVLFWLDLKGWSCLYLGMSVINFWLSYGHYND